MCKKLEIEIIKEEVNNANTKNFNIQNISFSVVPNLSKEYDLKNIIQSYIVQEDILEEEKLLNSMNKSKNNYSQYTKFDEKYENIYLSWLVHMFANFATNTIGFMLFAA